MALKKIFLIPPLVALLFIVCAENVSERKCHKRTTSGCSEIAWSDIESIIRAFYTGDDIEKRLTTARNYYDKGTLPGPYIKLIKAFKSGKSWKIYAIITGTDGFPVKGLSADNFTVETDGNKIDITNLTLLSVKETDETKVSFSAVIDDSGSINNCDATFLNDGLSLFFENAPSGYQAEIIKFTDKIYKVQNYTTDTNTLVKAVNQFCTNRGLTAMWDAVYRSLQKVPDTQFRATILFTDGIDNFSSRKKKEVIELAVDKKIPILIIGLGLADVITLDELADKTGGFFIYVPSSRKLIQAFQTAALFINNIYVIDIPANVSGEAKVSATESDETTVTSTIGLK